ncbi:MAG: SMP-30/gluconolactonase/LRE family protein [Rhodospirillales bacterium]|nr:SMP-30/gluconolactonase/LRE family protein [Rhodospirillales bacterium]
MMDTDRPLPRIGPDTAPFWAATRRGALALPWCEECARPHLPPGPVCPFCLSDRIAWRDAAGTGTVSSWTRVHKAWFPAFAAAIPYVVAQVELTEGPRLAARLVDLADAGPRVGMAVTVEFETLAPEIALPRFRPAPEAIAETPTAGLGECPLWDPARGLFWIDVVGRRMFRRPRAGGAITAWDLPRLPGSFAFRAGGGMLMAWRNGLGLIDPAAGDFQDLPLGPEGPDFAQERFNDGACDRLGRFWTGTMARNLRDPVGHLYRIDPDRSVHRMADGVILSNGIAWSSDDRTLYHCDSAAGAVFAHAFDLAAGTLGPRRVFADFAGRSGRPDGCAIDAEDHLWVAAVEAGEVLRFAPSGALAGTIRLPVACPTSLAFGDTDLRTLYVTTLRPTETEPEPDAGRVFALRPGVAGIVKPCFAG